MIPQLPVSLMFLKYLILKFAFALSLKVDSLHDLTTWSTRAIILR